MNNIEYEKVIRNYCNTDDIDDNTIAHEISLYMNNYKDEFIYDEKFGHYKMKNSDIWLTGDNLITYRQTGRRMLHVRKFETDNDDLFSSYIPMPYVAGGGPRSDVNKARNSTAYYSDNPFCFFETLRNEYTHNFEIEDDNVQKAICATKNFWMLFKDYESYIKAFCLESLRELKENVEYKKFFDARLYDKEDWPIYCKLMSEFRNARMKAVYDRIK